MGGLPTCVVIIDISGRARRSDEVSWLVIELLNGGGVATDGWSGPVHLWTRQEIQNGTVIDGQRFCDFLNFRQPHAWRELQRQNEEEARRRERAERE
jgi:hypothetical protein